jgi:hypothetical protein
LSKEFWIGLALSIPIGIICGLLVGPIQRWYQDWGKSREAARRERIEKEYAETLKYLLFPHSWTHYLLRRVMETIILFIGLSMGNLFLLATVELAILAKISGKPIDRHDRFFLFFILIAAAVTLTIFIAWFTQAIASFLRTSTRRARFHSYVQTLPNNIRNLELEKEALKLYSI